MCTSATDANRQCAGKTAFVYLLIGLFCAFFGAVYELFSHDVYSFYMIYAFAFPLVLGALPFSNLAIGSKKCPSPLSRGLYHCGVATLTVGSIMQGILEIYGTTNALTHYYWSVGALLLISGVIAWVLPQKSE